MRRIGLQAAIRGGRTLPFDRLLALDSAAFYGDGSALHYAKSRYLLYNAQLKGLLVTYYRVLLANGRDDPTLGRVLREPDMGVVTRDGSPAREFVAVVSCSLP